MNTWHILWYVTGRDHVFPDIEMVVLEAHAQILDAFYCRITFLLKGYKNTWYLEVL